MVGVEPHCQILTMMDGASLYPTMVGVELADKVGLKRSTIAEIIGKFVGELPKFEPTFLYKS